MLTSSAPRYSYFFPERAELDCVSPYWSPGTAWAWFELPLDWLPGCPCECWPDFAPLVAPCWPELPLCSCCALPADCFCR